MKPVGKPDAGNRHVRFDERGRETELTPPRPSSTLPWAFEGTIVAAVSVVEGVLWASALGIAAGDRGGDLVHA
ncbi:MAG: hypothetical protein WCB49_10975, partial [Gammaproteobacteria bacterium]